MNAYLYPKLLARIFMMIGLSGAATLSDAQTFLAEDEMVMALRGQRGTGSRSASLEPVKIEVETRSMLLPSDIARIVPRGCIDLVSVLDEDIVPVSQRKDQINSQAGKLLIKVERVEAPQITKPAEVSSQFAAAPPKPSVNVIYTVDPLASIKGNIKFAQDSVTIVGKDSMRYLKLLAKVLARDEFKKFTFAIEGHASADGPAEYNQRLSQQRANAIFWKLVNDYGIASDRLLPIGFGETKAEAPEGAPLSDLQNDRRVMIVKMDQEA